MKLSFVPRRGSMPKWPGKGSGTYPYIGRHFDTATRQNVADDGPIECVAKRDGKMTDEGRRLAYDFCKRDGDLLPADAETAAFCGVDFLPVRRVDGEGWETFAPKADGKASK